VEALEGDLADIEEAQPQQMAESPAMGALGQLAAILPAVVDKWFENQKENREIEKAKLYQAAQARQAQAQYQSNGNSDYDHFSKIVDPDLKRCETPEQMLQVLMYHYDLDCKLGTITSLAFRQGLKTAVKMIDAKAKSQASALQD
jgi:hypothetical protein